MNILPEIKSTVLDNGLRIYIAERPGQPSVELECHVRTGSIHENHDLGCGLSHFLEHMMFQGCRDFPGTAAADKLGELGGDVNAYTGFDRTVYHCELPSRHWAEGLKVIANMVQYPEFPAERFASEKEVILRECELGRDNPDRRLIDALLSNTFQSHPVRIPIIGYPGKIAQVTREMMTDYYNRRYSPSRAFWVIAGDVNADEVFAELNKLCGTWQEGRLDEPVLPAEQEQTSQRICNTEFDDPLARLAVGITLPGAAHPDIPALDIMCGLLGMSDASRLVRKLRQESELAMNVESFCYVQPFGGILAIAAGTTPGKLGKLEKALLRELEDIRQNGFTTREIKREQTQQYAEQLRTLRSNRGITGVISAGIYAENSPYMTERYMERLLNVTAADVKRVAEKYLSPERLTIIRQTPPGFAKKQKITLKENRKSAPAEKFLSNGAKFVSIEDKFLPLIDCAIVLPGGALREKAEHSGISRLLSDMLSAGCAKYSEGEIADRLESLGATFSASAGLNSFTIRVNSPRKTFKKLITLLGDMLNAPLFGEKEFQREKSNMLDALSSRMQQPRFVADRVAAKTIFGSHPYSNGTFGTADSIANITPEILRKFYRSICVPSQSVIAIGGDLSHAEATEFAEELAENIEWSSTEMPMPVPPEYPAEAVCQNLDLQREQTVVEFCLPCISCLAPETPAFTILSDAMNGLSSPLFKRIREDNALAYSTGMRHISGWQGGMLTFFAVTTSAQAARALELLKETVNNLINNGLSQSEFDKARDGAVFNTQRVTADLEGALYASALSVFYGRKANQTEEDMETLKAITPEEVNRILKSILGKYPGVTVTVSGK